MANNLPTYVALASTLSGDAIAASGLEGDVTVWTTTNLQQVGRLQTSLDPLGSRLAIVELNRDLRVVTGSWDHREVAAYDAVAGTRIWARAGLRRVHRVAPARDGSAIAVAFDRGPIQILDSRTGDYIADIRGARSFWQSPFSAFGVAAQTSRIAVVDVDDWHTRWTAPVTGFAVLAVSFSRDGILVSDVVDTSGPGRAVVTCYSPSGDVQWTYHRDRETNVPWLGWDMEADQWLGVEHNVDKGGSAALVRWSRHGELLDRRSVHTPEPYAFAAGGRLLVTSQGRLVDVRTMLETGRLP